MGLIKAWLPARIVDRSRGGLGLETGVTYDVGTVLRVRLADDPEGEPGAVIRVRYREASAPGSWRLGCEFLE
jgi:hypothetical protein